MNRIEQYFGVMPWWMWGISVFACITFLISFFAFTPKNARIMLALAIMIVWIELGRWPGLGYVQTFAKTTYILPVLFIGCLALISDAPKRKPSVKVLMIPIAGTIALAWLITRAPTIELLLHVIQIVVCISAILVARLCWAEDQTRQVLYGVFIGFSVSLLVPLFKLVTNPGASFIAGLNRFAPYKSNPNQIGPIFIIGCAAGAYLLLANAGLKMRIWGIALLAASIGMGLLTGSRSIVFIQAIILIPTLYQAIKKPLVAMIGIAVVVVLTGLIITQSAQTIQQSRLTNLDSARYALQLDYAKVIIQNPLIGYGTMNVQQEGETWRYGSHAHSAYLQMAHFAGIPYTVIVVFPTIVAYYAGVKVWRYRKQYPDIANRYLFGLMLLTAFILQGLTATFLYYPTYSVSFLHILIVSWLISSWNFCKRNEPIELYQPSN